MRPVARALPPVEISPLPLAALPLDPGLFDHVIAALLEAPPAEHHVRSSPALAAKEHGTPASPTALPVEEHRGSVTGGGLLFHGEGESLF